MDYLTQLLRISFLLPLTLPYLTLRLYQITGLSITNRAYKKLNNCNRALIYFTDAFKILRETNQNIVEVKGFCIDWIVLDEHSNLKLHLT